MPLKIVRDDLVNMRADAIVLPSNEKLVVDGGAGMAVARKAGLLRVRRACRKLGGCAVGSAAATPAFSFPAKYLIHAVGPVWDGSAESARLLRAAYDSSLRLAAQLGCASIALPLLSAGSFGCPAHVSLSIALASVEAHVTAADVDLDVTLVLFDRRAVSAGLDFLGEIESRIDDAYAEGHRPQGTAVLDDYPAGRQMGAGAQMPMPMPDSRMAAPSQDAGRFASANSANSANRAPDAFSMPSGARGGTPSKRERVQGWLQGRTKPISPESAAGGEGPARAQSGRGDESAPSDAWGAPTLDESRMPGASEDAFEASCPSETGSFSLPALRETSAADTTAVLEQRFDVMDEGFSATLLGLIDASGMTDAQVYRRANMSRQHFSKIRSNVGYRPSKATVLALCVALELDLAQTRDLLARAGFALSHASKFDIILEYFIERGMYDQFKINETLFYFDQPLLGG